MQFNIKKDDLQRAVTVITKLVGKPDTVLIEAKDGFLTVKGSDTVYASYKVPANIQEEGAVGLHFKVFNDLVKLRKKELEFSYDEKLKTLSVNGGSNKIDIYTRDASPEDYVCPESEWDVTLNLTAKAVGVLRKRLDRVSFTYQYGEDFMWQAQLANTDKTFCIKSADLPHCAFYEYKEPMAKKKFKFQSAITPIKTALNFLDSEAVLSISSSLMKVESDMLVATLSANQDEQNDYIAGAEAILDEKDYFAEGSLVFDADKFARAIESVGIVQSSVEDSIEMKVNGTKVKLLLKTSSGRAEARFSLTENTYKDKIDNITFNPALVQDILNSCSKVNKEVRLTPNKDESCFIMESKDDKCRVLCLGPFLGV